MGTLTAASARPQLLCWLSRIGGITFGYILRENLGKAYADWKAVQVAFVADAANVDAVSLRSILDWAAINHALKRMDSPRDDRWQGLRLAWQTCRSRRKEP